MVGRSLRQGRNAPDAVVSVSCRQWAVFDYPGTLRMALSNTQKTAIGLALVALALALTIGAKSKSMFTVYVFSDVKGQVVDGGKPIVRATIVRSYDWRWGNKKGQDETTTDANGEFAFPPIKKIMLLGSVLPHEPYIEQLITIKVGDKPYKAWSADKRNYALFGEIVEFYSDKKAYKPMDLYCDIEVEPKRQKRGYSDYYGIAVLKL